MLTKLIQKEEQFNQVGSFVIKSSLFDEVEIVKNRLMDITINSLIQKLIGIETDIEIKYLAIGTSDTPVTNTDTKLGNEVLRVSYISRSNPSVGRTDHGFKILDTEANVNIRELGIYGGSSATSTKDSGTLLARVLYSKDKNVGEEIDVTRIDIIQRG